VGISFLEFLHFGATLYTVQI